MPINSLNKSYQDNPRVITLSNHIGFVKRNDDAQRMGRLSVFIPELGGDADDPGAWIIVSYASPFAGATDPSKIQPGSQTYDGSQQSYGLWMVPPDLNNEVAIFFANNDIARGFWFGCCYQQNMNWMVPGIATNVTTEPPDPNLHTGPVVEYNKANVGSVDNPQRPRFTPLSEGLATEGLTGDNERGSTSSSARREAPSQVYGLLTPRGNNLYIDDNPANEFIRLRTRSGAQVLVHETSGYVYINSKNGNSWIEISDAGVDVYTAKSISLRAEGDFNVRADGNINLDAGSNINLRGGANVTVAGGGDVQVQAGNKVNLTAGSNVETVAGADMHVVTGGMLQAAVGSSLAVTAGAGGSIKTGDDFQLGAGGALRLQSGGDTSQLAGGKQVRDGSTILDNTKAAAPATTMIPLQVTPPVLPIGLLQGDAKQTFASATSDQTLWKAGGNHVNTIVARMPTHEPWREHPNADVPPPPTEEVDIQAQGTYDSGSSSNTNPDGTINDAGCNVGASDTHSISTDVYNAIMNACTKTGADPATMLAFGDMESGFQPGISAKTSSATGLYQFVASTWQAMVTKYGARYNVGFGQINDATANALMGGQFLCDNVAILKSKGISNPTPGQCYIVHFAGSGGGPAMILAAQKTPDADATTLFPSAAGANRSIFAGKSISQVVATLSAKADAKAKAYAGQYGKPAPCDRGTAGSGAINMNTQPSGSIIGSPPPGGTPANVPVGLSGNVGQPASSLAALKPGAGGYCGTTHQCVALVQSTGLPVTSRWRKGSTDQRTWSKGQPIAVFDDNGMYGNHTNGSSHAAIFLSLAGAGNPTYTGKMDIHVYDQWVGQPAHERVIQNNPAKAPINNAACYAAINIV